MSLSLPSHSLSTPLTLKLLNLLTLFNLFNPIKHINKTTYQRIKISTKQLY